MRYMTVTDEPRPSSRLALHQLYGVNPSIHMVMLTGNENSVARQFSARLPEIDETYAALLLGEKLKAVEKLRGRWGRVAMVGDGINDAPARADLPVYQWLLALQSYYSGRLSY